MSLSFNIEPSADGRAFRLNADEFKYTASKAQIAKIPFTDKDNLKVAIAYRFRSLFFTKGAPPIVFKAEPVTMSATVKQVEEGKLVPGKLKNGTTDWLPAPQTDLFSFRVTVTESSDVKKWLDKVADKLDEFGDG